VHHPCALLSKLCHDYYSQKNHSNPHCYTVRPHPTTKWNFGAPADRSPTAGRTLRLRRPQAKVHRQLASRRITGNFFLTSCSYAIPRRAGSHLPAVRLVDQEFSDPIIDEAPGMLEGFPVTPVEGPYSYFGLYATVTNSTQGRLLGEASTSGDWPVFDGNLVDPSFGDGFFPQMLPQLDPFEFLTQPSYPTAGLGQAFQPIALAPALNAVVQPNNIAPSSRAYAPTRRRTNEPRFQCNIDGCIKVTFVCMKCI